jgi:hypothetical protein
MSPYVEQDSFGLLENLAAFLRVFEVLSKFRPFYHIERKRAAAHTVAEMIGADLNESPYEQLEAEASFLLTLQDRITIWALAFIGMDSLENIAQPAG